MGYPQVLDNKIRKIKADKDISKRNKELLIKFKDDCFSIGLSVRRVLKYMYTLPKFAVLIDKDFDKATKEDIKKLVSHIQTSDYKDWTKRDFKVCLKRFYKWIYDLDDTYPEQVKWIKTKDVKESPIKPENVLTPDDIKKMIEKADNIRDRALISVLYESGARYHEFEGIKKSSVQESGDLIKLFIESKKTFSRTVTLIESIPYLRLWLQHHPLRGEKNFFIWINTSNNRKVKDKSLSYNSLNKIVSTTAAKAKITKPTNLHAFRHARATYLSKKLSDASMCRFFGWYPGTRMVRTYSHLSDKDIENELLEAYGHKKRQEILKEKKKLTKPCPRCRTDNLVDTEFCSTCWLNLSVQEAGEQQQKESFANKVMAKGFENEEFRTIIKDLVKEVLQEERSNTL